MRDTKATRTARDNEGNPYARKFPFRGWSQLVTVLDDHRLMARLPEFQHWTHAQHIDLAIHRLYTARDTRAEYGKAVDHALATFGNGSGVLISGVYRDHFPPEVKDRLRALAHAVGHLQAVSMAHWLASGKRSHTWRRTRDEVMR